LIPSFKKIFPLFLIGFVFVCNCFGQGSSNKGTDFWLGYGKHISVGNMVLYITSDVNTTSTVTIPALGFTQTVSVIANTVVPVDIPTTAHLNVDGPSNNGIHITSLKPIIVYAHIYDNSVSGATLVLPVNTLGKDYYSINYKQISNSKGSVSWFFVVAVEDNTTVEITPSGDTQGGWLANVKQTITLNKGQIYNVLGKFTDNGSFSSGVDLTGSRIKSISSNGTCKRIAVFSGSSKIAINCLSYNFTGANPGSADNLFQQAYPTATWGKNFITVPQKDRNFVIYRILKSDPTAVVKVNGAVVPSASFINNFYYDFASQQVDQVSSDKPIQLVQYAVTQGKSITCGTASGDVGDPEMIYLNPLEQTLTQITMYSTDRYKILKHFINVVVKNEGVASFKLDGLSASSNFSPVPGNTQYSYAQLTVQSGTHNLSSDVGFNAIAYGFGGAESYGYAAGANLTSFGIDPVKQGTDSTSVATGCVGTPYDLNLKLPYQALDIQLDKFDGKGFQVVNVTNGPLTTTTKDGVTTYIYSLIPNVIYTKDSTYTYKVRTTKPSADDCGTGDEFTFDFIVNPKPIADFSVSPQTCYSDSVKFKNVIVNSKIILNGYLWDFNGEGSSTLENPTFKFATPGVKKIKFSVKSQDGCWSDVISKDIEVMQQPVASFTTSSITCLNQAIQFTDASTTVGQTISKWEWDFGDGSAISNNQNPSHTYTIANQFDVKLTVTTNLGCVNTKIVKITVNPLPNASFDAPAICIYDPSASFTNTSTTADNSVLTFEWDFGDPSSGTNNLSTLKNPTHSYSQAKVYTVSLTVTSANGCVTSISKPFTVNPRPIADFTAPSNTCLGDVTAFTNTMVSGQNISDYLWDFNGEGNSTLQNPTFKFTTAGIKKINFSLKSQEGCWSDVTTKNIEIMQLPVAAFTISKLTCLNQNIQFTDASTTVGQTITKWEWDFGDGSAISNNQNPSHTYTSVNQFDVKLTVSTNLGCSTTLIKQIVINPLPVVNFDTPDICLSDASATFTNKSTISDNSTLSFVWDFGDSNSSSVNNTSTQTNPSHKYTQAKNYDVKLTTTSANGCVTTLSKVFTVNGSTPKSNFEVLNDTKLCSDQLVGFKDLATVDFGEITRIDWYYDDATPNVVETDNQPTKRADVAKVYNHKYPTFYSPAQRVVNVKMITYSGNSSTCRSTLTKSITLKAVPIAEFTIPTSCLTNGEAKFINNSSFDNATTGLTYAWDFGDDQNNTSTDKDPIHQFKTAKDYTIKLVVTSGNGCSTTISKTFTVTAALPNPNFSVVNDDLCSNFKVLFKDEASIAFGEIIKIDWQFDAVNHPNDPAFSVIDNNPNFRADAAKIYEFTYAKFNSPLTKDFKVTMTATSASGCVSEISKIITLKAVPNVEFTTIPAVCEEFEPFNLTQGAETSGFIGKGVYSGAGIDANGLFSPKIAGVGTHTITYNFLAIMVVVILKLKILL
jgi:PKD repeat protein